MISFDRDGVRFHYRVAGICMHDGYVLLHRADRDDYWALPGGRCELGESSDATLRREMQEELNVPVTVGRLLWVVENFFTLTITGHTGGDAAYRPARPVRRETAKGARAMQKIYTGRGDDGYTSLIGGARVAKYDPRPEAYGTLDEASAALGLARATATLPDVRAAILEMQRALYRLMAELATVEGKTSAYEMTEADVARVEELTNAFTAQVPVQREFVVPGDTVAGAALDVARTVVRRGERLATRLVHEGHNANPHVLRFLNRLSSLLFILGRAEDTRQTGHTSTAAKEEQTDS